MSGIKQSLKSLLSEYFGFVNVDLAVVIGLKTVAIYGSTEAYNAVKDTEMFRGFIGSLVADRSEEWPQHERLCNYEKRIYGEADFGPKSGLGFMIVVVDTRKTEMNHKS